MQFAVSKAWLPPDLQNDMWLWAHDTPHVRVTRDVTVISRPRQRGLPIQQLMLNPGVRHLTAMGRVCVNPCSQCELTEMTGIGEFCGGCRSRPWYAQQISQTRS